jgi:hypothetical protein
MVPPLQQLLLWTGSCAGGDLQKAAGYLAKFGYIDETGIRQRYIYHHQHL